MAAIEIEGLTKKYRRGTLAVDNLSFEVQPGQVCGLLGPNGAGKTTTLRLLLGLLIPRSGTASILGQRIRPGHLVLGRVGVLVEDPAAVPHLTGMKNLEIFWRSGGGKWPAPGLDEGLALAGLGAAIDKKTKTYSHGMKQRLGLAQAMLNEPEVLILDEPTTGLDPGEMREIRRLIAGFSDRGSTVLLSSHILAEVEQVCSHVVVMNRGKFVAAGPVAELAGGAAAVYLEVDDVEAAIRVLGDTSGVLEVEREGAGLQVRTGDISRPAIVKRLVEAGVGVATVSSRNQLEAAFLQLVEEEAP